MELAMTNSVPVLEQTKGAVVLMSGNSAIFPKAHYAAVGTINAAIATDGRGCTGIMTSADGQSKGIA
jgi:cytosine/adenosine deaminase-related metal-dependent hydrolase